MSGAQSLGAGMRICGCRDDVITLEGELILLIWLHRLLSIMHSIRVCEWGSRLVSCPKDYQSKTNLCLLREATTLSPDN